MTEFAEIIRGMRNRMEKEALKCRASGCPTMLDSATTFCEFHLRLLANRKHPFMYTAGPEQATYLDSAVEDIARIESRGRDV